MKMEILKLKNDGSIVLPSSYIMDLGLRDEILCILEDGELIIRPFYKEIKEESKSLLDRLKDEGYTGEELLLEYKRRKSEESV